MKSRSKEKLTITFISAKQSGPSQLEALKSRAGALIEVKRWHDAIQTLHQAPAIAPQDGDTLRRLASAYFNAGDNVHALTYAERAIAVEPDPEWGHRLRASVLLREGRRKEALKSCEEARRLAPDEPYVYLLDDKGAYRWRGVRLATGPVLLIAW